MKNSLRYLQNYTHIEELKNACLFLFSSFLFHQAHPDTPIDLEGFSPYNFVCSLTKDFVLENSTPPPISLVLSLTQTYSFRSFAIVISDKCRVFSMLSTVAIIFACLLKIHNLLILLSPHISTCNEYVLYTAAYIIPCQTKRSH